MKAEAISMTDCTPNNNGDSPVSSTANVWTAWEGTAHLNAREDGPVTVVRFGQHVILDDWAIRDVGNGLYSVAARIGCQHLLLDFSCVVFLGSTMLGKLVTLNKKMHSKGGKLTLFGLGPEVREVFSVTKLDQILDILDGEPEALESIEP